MKFPVCDKCLKSGVLCENCRAKDIRESDFRIFRSVDRLTSGSLDGVELIKVLEAFDLLVLVVDNPGRFHAEGGLALKNLSDEYERPVRVVGRSRDHKEFLKGLLHPAEIIGVNVLYLPDREILKVKVPKGSDIPISLESINEIMLKEYGKEISILKE